MSSSSSGWTPPDDLPRIPPHWGNPKAAKGKRKKKEFRLLPYQSYLTGLPAWPENVNPRERPAVFADAKDDTYDIASRLTEDERKEAYEERRLFIEEQKRRELEKQAKGQAARERVKRMMAAQKLPAEFGEQPAPASSSSSSVAQIAVPPPAPVAAPTPAPITNSASSASSSTREQIPTSAVGRPLVTMPRRVNPPRESSTKVNLQREAELDKQWLKQQAKLQKQAPSAARREPGVGSEHLPPGTPPQMASKSGAPREPWGYKSKQETKSAQQADVEPPRRYLRNDTNEVYVAQIPGKGKGLKALMALEPNTRIVYKGKWIRQHEFERLREAKQNAYVVQSGNAGWYVNGDPLLSGKDEYWYASFINEPSPGQKENVKIHYEADPSGKHDWRPVMVVIRLIHANEELVTLYGDDYEDRGYEIDEQGSYVEAPAWMID